MTQVGQIDGGVLVVVGHEGGEAAFAVVVERHGGWVFACALRQLRDRQLAEDATQAVFLLLYRKWDAMRGHQNISGWLFNSMRYVVRGMMRKRQREMRREVEVGKREVAGGSEVEWVWDLDAAVANLSSGEREVVVLRFYQGMEFGEMGRALAVSEEAARKRVGRAVMRLRKMLGAGVSAEAVMGAATVGLEKAPGDLAGGILRAARETPGAGTVLAAKGASKLMMLAKVKVAAVILLVVAAAGSAGGYFFRPSAQTVAAPASGPVNAQAGSGDALAEFKRVYALKDDEVLIRIPPPWPAGRLAYYRKMNPGTPDRRGPDAMMFKWQDGGAVRCEERWGSSASVNNLAETILNIYPQEVEGDASLAGKRIPGDFVFRPGAKEEDYLAAMEKILEEMGTPMKLSFAEVDRKVIVASGHWKFTPVDETGKNWIEMYGAKLNEPRHIGGGGGGDGKEFAEWLGRFIKQQVILEADGVPALVSWHENEQNIGSMDLVVKHIEEQTGLACNVEMRKVRRLIVEQGGL